MPANCTSSASDTARSLPLRAQRSRSNATWNLLIDVVAQSGRYAPGETDLKKFNVQGGQHYWIHVAIDRFTGQVLDKQIEVVKRIASRQRATRLPTTVSTTDFLLLAAVHRRKRGRSWHTA